MYVSDSQRPAWEKSPFLGHSAEETFVQLASGERDLAIGRFEALPDGIRRARLYADRLVCLVREGHPRIRDRLTMKRSLAESHLSAESAAPVERPFTIEGLLAERGLRVLAPPFPAPSFELHLAWHARTDRDEGSAWLRERILSLFAEDQNP